MTNNLNSNTKQFEDFDEVDLAKIFRILFLNKKIIFFTTIIFVIFGYLNYLFKKPIWQGQFDIVLRNNSNSLVNQNPLQAINSGTLSQFIQRASVFDIKTEVMILKSQSTLRPVFNFVKKEYKKKGTDISGLTFNSWLNNLDIKTKRDTSVLNIKYNSADKDIIIPVLRKISTEYQKYSGRDRDKGLLRGIDYLKKQKENLTIDSRRSIAELQEFALENNLADFDEFMLPSLSTGIASNNKGINSTNSEINSITSRFKPNFKQLYLLESALVTKSTLLKPNAPQIIALKSQIDSLKKSLDRPSAILMKFRDLRREAIRTEQLLVNVEGQLEVLKLDLARKEEPWELISDVTMFSSPVSPNRNKTLFFSLLIGLGLSSIYSLISYKRKDLIDSFESFKKVLPYDYIKTFSIKNRDSWENSFLMIKEKFSLDTSKNKLGFLFLNSSRSENSDLFINSINLSKDENIIPSTSLNSLTKCKNLIIVSEPDSISNSNLKYLIEDLELSKSNIVGWIYIV